LRRQVIALCETGRRLEPSRAAAGLSRLVVGNARRGM
jgi:hypothetical protein